MFRLIKSRTNKAGLPPGTVIYVGKQKARKTRIQLIDYDETHIEEKEIRQIEEAFEYADAPRVTWINIDGLEKVDVIEKIGKHFQLHPLVLEDIANTEQRPKMEDYTEYLYIVLKMLRYDEKESEILTEQISLVFKAWINLLKTNCKCLDFL